MREVAQDAGLAVAPRRRVGLGDVDKAGDIDMAARRIGAPRRGRLVSSARYFAVWRARSANGVQLDSMRPKPIFAATLIERSVAPARKIGGCGCCNGCGNSS